jgi:hypothetical protein
VDQGPLLRRAAPSSRRPRLPPRTSFARCIHG